MSVRIEKRLSISIRCRKCGQKENKSFLLYGGSSFVSDGSMECSQGYFFCTSCGDELEKLFANIDKSGLTSEKADKIIKVFVDGERDGDNFDPEAIKGIL